MPEVRKRKSAVLSRSLAFARNLREEGKRVLRSSLFRGGALSLLIQVQSAAVQLLTGIILARTLGPDDLGTYSFAIATLALIQVIPNSGLDNVVIRYTAQYRAQKSWMLLRGLWQTAVLASIAYGLFSAGAILGAYFLNWLPTTAALSPPVLAAAAILMIFLPLLTFEGAALRGISPGVIGQLPQHAIKPWIYVLMLVAILATARHALTAEVAMYAQGVAVFITTLIGIRWLVKHRPTQVPDKRLSYDLKRWVRPIPAFCLLSGLMLINLQADLLMLGILSTARETGIYKVAATGASVVTLSLVAANLYIAPRISAMYSRGEKVGLQRLLSLSARSTFAVAMMVACVFWLWGLDILRLVFGVAYLRAFWPLVILCAGQLFNVGTGSVGLILGMTGNESDAAKAAAVSAVANIALNVALIPSFAGIGAAVSTMITMVIWNTLMLISVKQKTGLSASILGVRMVS